MLPRVSPDGGGGTVILAEMGTNVLEFATISRITGVPTYREQAEKGMRAVHAANPNVSAPAACFGCQGCEGCCSLSTRSSSSQPWPAAAGHQAARLSAPACCPACAQALLLEAVDRQTGRETGSTRGVGAGTDSYYE